MRAPLGVVVEAPGPPGSGEVRAFASTTATYGSRKEPAMNTHMNQCPMLDDASTKQTVRMPIEIR